MQADLAKPPVAGRGSFWQCLARPGLVAQLSEPNREENREARESRG